MNKERGFLGSVLRIALSSAGAQAVVFLSLPILARFYNAESFGVWALIQSASLLLGAIATFRYDLAVVLPKEHIEAVSVLGVGILVAFFVSVFTAMAIPFFAPVLFGHKIILPLIYWAIPLLVFFTAVNQLALSWNIRTESFTLYGLAQLGLALLSAALPLYLATNSSDPFGLIAGTVFATGVVAVLLWGKIFYFLFKENLWGGVSLPKFWLAAVQYRNYPCYMTPYTLLGTIRDRLIYFLMGNFSGANEVGLYSMAQRLTNAPNSLAASALRPVFFQRVAQADHEQILQIVRKVMSWLVVLSIPPATFFFFFPEKIITLLFGKEWAKASSYVMILAIPMLPLMLGNWMDRYFDALGRQRLVFRLELAFSILVAFVLVLAFNMGVGAKNGVIIQAAIMTSYFTIWIAVLFYVAHIPMLIFWKIVGLILVILSISWVCIYFLSYYLGFWETFFGFLVLWCAGLIYFWKQGEKFCS